MIDTKNISLLDRIIFWLDRLILSVSINSHPDNIYFSRYSDDESDQSDITGIDST
jgi:hypothetical protein